MQKRDTWILGVLVFAVYGLFLSYAAGWNVESRWALAIALAREGTTRIDGHVSESRDVCKVNDHTYSAKAPGMGLLCAPLVWILDRAVPPGGEPKGDIAKRYICRLVFVSLPGALLAVLISAAATPVVAVACCLGTPILPYSTLLYGHVTSAFCLFLSWRLMRTRNPRPFLSGLTAGLAVLVEYSAMLPVLAIFVIGLIRKRKLGGRFVLGATPWVAVLLIYNLVSFGTLLATGYSGFEDETFQEAVDTGVGGFSLPSGDVFLRSLVGKYRGLLFLSPWLVLWPVAVLLVCKTWEERITGAILPVVYIVLFSGFVVWWGGASCCMRHFIILIPFMAMPIARLRGRWLYLLVGLAFISTAIHLGFTVIEPETPEDFLFPLKEMVIPWLAAERLRSSTLSWVVESNAGGAVVAVVLSIAAWILVLMEVPWNRTPRDVTADIDHE